jgi:uracil-DNA glycosylase
MHRALLVTAKPAPRATNPSTTVVSALVRAQQIPEARSYPIMSFIGYDEPDDMTRSRMATLHECMGKLVTGWPDQLPSDWRKFFVGCRPQAATDISEKIELAEGDTVFPGRRDPDAPGSPHFCRAFDGIAPEDVRVVVLGEDPYPDPSQATGRAFEDGAWNGNFAELSESLQPLIRSALALAWNRSELHHAAWDWNAVCADLAKWPTAPDAMSSYFNDLATQGVLFMNAAWTRTSKDKSADEKERIRKDRKNKSAHQKIWRPLTGRLIENLAAEDRPIVFLLLGGKAAESFCRGDQTFRKTAVVRSAHPSSLPKARKRYIACSNPLARVNAALRNLGDNRDIVWWPPNLPASA